MDTDSLTQVYLDAWRSVVGTLAQTFEILRQAEDRVIFRAPGLTRDCTIIARLDDRAWSTGPHVELVAILAEIDKVNLAGACMPTGMLRGGLFVHDVEPYHVGFRESWPLRSIDSAEVIAGAKVLAIAVEMSQ